MTVNWPDLTLPPINLNSMPDAKGLTPCVKKCKLNDNDVCTGCGRTLVEIKEWPLYTLQQKSFIIKRLKQETDNE